MQEIDELLQAITALEAQRPALGDRVVNTALAPLYEKLADLEQHQPASRLRRLVTVFFLDIVNSTMLSQGLEPEEVQEVIGGVLKRLSMPIKAYGGLVTEYMGDGFVAVFGLARTHENDARQAVRAGLAILTESHLCADELEHRYRIPGFSVRIGINTGRVVAGRFSEAESPVMGLTVSLAARMEQAALPGTLFISQFTHQHVRGAFEFEALPPVEVKGFPKPIEIYRVLSARPRTFRTFSRGVEGIETRLIGRETELTLLKATLTHAIQNRETQLVTVVGEAGVGKSRLLYEFDRWVAHAPFRVLAFKVRSSPQTMTVPFGMLRDMISYRLGLLITDPIQITRQKLVEGLSQYLEDDPEMKAHFVGSLLGFDFSDNPYLQGMKNDPRQLNERAQHYLTQCFTSAASKSGIILMLDDLHWADTPSVSYITHLVSECKQLPMLVVCLARPTITERFPSWGKEEAYGSQSIPLVPSLNRSQRLALAPLSRQASQELLNEILRNVENLPEALRDRILDSADGNPFYLEEYIQSLVDAKGFTKNPEGGAWRIDLERLGSFELPTTLIALLEARLDSLNIAQRVIVQQASVIGRVFWRSALLALRGEKTIADAELESLSRRGFIILQEASAFAGTEEYRFHHALLRDVAYQALLKSDRQTYHGQTAAWLTSATQDGGRTGEFAPVIAEHYELAGKRDLAADWYAQAGARARNQGAPSQARTFFDHALTLLPPELGPSTAASDLERRWQALAGRDEVLGILGDTEARTADDIALVALAELIGDNHMIAEACYRKGYYLTVRGQYLQALDAYDHGLTAAVRANDLRSEALMLGLKAVCELRLGDLKAAAQTSAAALASAEKVGDDEVLVKSLTNVSAFYTETGDLARAAQLLDQQLTINRRTGNIEGEVVGLSNLGYAYILMGMPEKAISALLRSIEMAKAIGHRFFIVYGRLNLALARLRNGNTTSALEDLDQCLPELKDLNDEFGYAAGQIYTALAMEQCGRIHEALIDFEKATATFGKLGALGSTHDAEAGIARCMLMQDNQEAALRYVIPLWDYLQQQAGAGMEFPILAYETGSDGFSRAGELSVARLVIEAGYSELMARANKISLSEWRQSFLEGVPEHHHIQTRWQEYTEKSKA